MQQINNASILTDAEFFELTPQPPLSYRVVYQVSDAEQENDNPCRLSQLEVDEAIAILKQPTTFVGIYEEDDYDDTPNPNGAPDLSEYYSEEEMEIASRRLYELTNEVRQEQEDYAQLGPQFTSDIFDDEEDNDYDDTPNPNGAPDLSEFYYSGEVMEAASRRLYEITTEVRQEQGDYAPLGPQFASLEEWDTIYDEDLQLYFPITPNNKSFTE